MLKPKLKYYELIQKQSGDKKVSSEIRDTFLRVCCLASVIVVEAWQDNLGSLCMTYNARNICIYSLHTSHDGLIPML